MSNNFLADYNIKYTIGKGTFSTVKFGTVKLTDEKVAIKIIDKNKAILKNLEDLKRIDREIEIIKKMKHINIIKIIKSKEDQNNVYIIMEYVNDDLFSLLASKKNNCLSEEESSMYYYQLINGLEYIHSKKICHRDLKPENLLITKNKILKIIDFGLSNFFDENSNLLKTLCGSPNYAPPEMVSRKKYNGFYSDIWTTGVILYVMLCGCLPFTDDNKENNDELFEKIRRCEINYPKNISLKGLNLMKKILVADPEKRIKISEIKKHPFYLLGKKIFEELHPELKKDPIREKLLSGNEDLSDSEFGSDIQKSNSTNFYIKFKIFGDKISSKNKLDKTNTKFNDSKNYDKAEKNIIQNNKCKDPFFSSIHNQDKNKPNFTLLKKILRGKNATNINNNVDYYHKEYGNTLSHRVSKDKISPANINGKHFYKNTYESCSNKTENSVINNFHKKYINRGITPEKNEKIPFPKKKFSSPNDDINKNFLFNSHHKKPQRNELKSEFDIIFNESKNNFTKYNSNSKFKNDTLKPKTPINNNFISYTKLYPQKGKEINDSCTSSNASLSRAYNFRKQNNSHYTFNKSIENKNIGQKSKSIKNRNLKNKTKLYTMSTNRKTTKDDNKNFKNDNNVESMLSKKIIDINKYYKLYANNNSKMLKVDDLITFKEKDNGGEKKSATTEISQRRNLGNKIIVRKRKCNENLNNMSINGSKTLNATNYFNYSMNLPKQNKSNMVKVHKKKNVNRKNNNDGKILKYEIQEIIKKRCLGKKKVATKFN